MSGQVPDFVKKGKLVQYKLGVTKIKGYHFSCPCAVGDRNHHPDDDLLMVELLGVGVVPCSEIRPIAE